MRWRQRLLRLHDTLLKRFGPQHWWPGETPFEVMVGAVLTQNTAWTNVEKAIANLKADGPLTPERILDLAPPRLAELIRPSGYFNLKARRLRAVVQWFVTSWQGEAQALAAGDLTAARAALLGVYGVGEETADSILLYAAGHPTFVIDAYTRRLLVRLGWVEEDATYGELQQLFMAHLPADAPLFNEYHALIVALGKDICRPRPQCAACPLRRWRHRPGTPPKPQTAGS